MKKYIVLLLIIGFNSFAQKFSAMTYNIRLDVASDGENAWANRKDFLSSQVLFFSPDFLGVQEAKPNQMVDLKEALKEYQVIGLGRDGNQIGEHSSIFYNSEKFKIEKENTFWLSETPEIVSKGWDAAYPRICTYGLFTDLKTTKKIWVFNTHLDHLGEVARTKGIQLIVTKIAMLNTKNYPVIFMGDFNSEPTTERIVNLKKEMNDCRDASNEKPFGPSGTFNGFNHNQSVTTLIDYIFMSKNDKLKVEKYAVLSDSKDLKYPSDHLPVFVKLCYK